jgi:hypothetical protein
MTDYLYILPFQSGDYFKIGISSESYNRVLTHHQSFKINLNEVTIVVGTKKNIRTIERILLSLYDEVTNNPHEGKDGATEIRYNNDLEQCLKDIKYWSKRINLTIQHPTKRDIVPKIRREVKRLTNEEKKTRQQEQNSLDQEQNLFNISHFKKEIQQVFLKTPPDNIEGGITSYDIYWIKDNTPAMFSEELMNSNTFSSDIYTISPPNLLKKRETFSLGQMGYGYGFCNGYELFHMNFEIPTYLLTTDTKKQNHISKLFMDEYLLFQKWFEEIVSPYMDNNIMISAYERPIPNYPCRQNQP